MAHLLMGRSDSGAGLIPPDYGMNGDHNESLNDQEVNLKTNGIKSTTTTSGGSDPESCVKPVLKPLIICGPSGCGKSTLLRRLTAEFPDAFGFSVSHTTRQPRPGESDGKDYHFIDKDSMQTMVSADEFIEHTSFAGNMYGTSKAAVESVLTSGLICLLDIDVEGVKSLKKINMKGLYIFIKPPSVDVLEKRLRGRGTESEEKIAQRLARATAELEYGESGSFDAVIINHELDAAYQELRQAVLKELPVKGSE